MTPLGHTLLFILATIGWLIIGGIISLICTNLLVLVIRKTELKSKNLMYEPINCSNYDKSCINPENIIGNGKKDFKSLNNKIGISDIPKFHGFSNFVQKPFFHQSTNRDIYKKRCGPNRDSNSEVNWPKMFTIIDHIPDIIRRLSTKCKRNQG